MIHLETERECIVLRDEMKVMIACDHTQSIAIQQQGLTTKISWMGSRERLGQGSN